MLAQRRRRWANICPAFGHYGVLTGRKDGSKNKTVPNVDYSLVEMLQIN